MRTTPDPVNYHGLGRRDALVARVQVARERLDVSTIEDRDELLHDLLVRPWPTVDAQRA